MIVILQKMIAVVVVVVVAIAIAIAAMDHHRPIPFGQMLQLLVFAVADGQ